MKEFIDLLALTDKGFTVTALEWIEMNELRNVLHDCFLFTKRIQAVQFTLSDLYAEWIQVQLKLKKKTQNEFVTALITCLKERGESLLTDPLVLSALFLDVRYRVLLNADPIQKQLAMNHLTLLWKRVADLDSKSKQADLTKQPTHRTDIDSSAVVDVNANSNPMSDYLDSLELTLPNNVTMAKSEDIMFKLQQFNSEMEGKKTRTSVTTCNGFLG